MTSGGLTYAIVTPARNEAANLGRLAAALVTQNVTPEAWLIVDNGSQDETPALARALARQYSWIRFVVAEASCGATRAEPIVSAFHAGLRDLENPVDVVVKVDADVSMGSDFFERLLGEFARNASLGIASGIVYEEQPDKTWRQRHGTGSGVWGACRAYRWACLQDVLPLEERMGWDTIDLVKAHVRGWTTRAFLDLPFLHHRPEGARDGTTASRWADQGKAARYMGYRFSYLLVRATYRSLRHPAAAAMIRGYLSAAVRREPLCPDAELRAYVRRQQRVRELPKRIREALRPRQQLPLES